MGPLTGVETLFILLGFTAIMIGLLLGIAALIRARILAGMADPLEHTGQWEGLD